MTIAHLLEDFGVAATPGSIGKYMDEEALEDFRLNSFEQGYAAGWEDCVKAQESEHLRIATDLGSRLEDLSFTYQEALNQMLLSIEPIFDTLITKALPAAMARTQGELLLQHLVDMARETADVPVQIAVPVGAYAAVSRLVSDHPGMVIEVIEDAGLKPAQAHIRIGQTMREIDSDRVLAHFSDAIEAFYHQIREETRNG